MNINRIIKLDRYQLDGKLSTTIDYLNRIRDSIPAEYRDSAELSLSVDEDYGCYSVEADVQYWSPETDEEREARETKTRKQAALLAKRLREQLAELELKGY